MKYFYILPTFSVLIAVLFLSGCSVYTMKHYRYDTGAYYLHSPGTLEYYEYYPYTYEYYPNYPYYYYNAPYQYHYNHKPMIKFKYHH